MQKKRLALFLVLLLGVVQCNKKNAASSSSSCSNGVSGSANGGFTATQGTFTVSPVPTAHITSILPLGNLNPPGHTYPSDHIYLVLDNSSANAVNVYAAAAGTVTNIDQPSNASHRIFIQVDRSFTYYYDHINIANGVGVGSTVTAGELIGTNAGDAAAVDFGVWNFNKTLSGLLDSCIAEYDEHTDAPLEYYSGALRTTLYGLVTPASADGKIDYDISGKLSGDWVQNTSANALNDTSKQLAFVYEPRNPSLMRIVIGGTLTSASIYGVQGGATDFGSVTPASGQINYRLYLVDGSGNASGSQSALLAVSMNSNTGIQVEFFAGNVSGSASFDGSAQTYVR